MALWMPARFSSGENQGSIQFSLGGDGIGTKLPLPATGTGSWPVPYGRVVNDNDLTLSFC